MPTTTDTTPPPTSPAAALGAELDALKDKIAAKTQRRIDIAGELAAARAERDRLHRDDAPAATIAEHRARLRDLADESDGLAGAIDLLTRDVAALEPRLAEAEAADRAVLFEEAIARGLAAFAAYDAALRPVLTEATPALMAALEEAGQAVRRNDPNRGMPGAGAHYNRVIRPHARLLHVAQTLLAFATEQTMPLTTRPSLPAAVDVDPPLALRTALTASGSDDPPLALR